MIHQSAGSIKEQELRRHIGATDNSDKINGWTRSLFTFQMTIKNKIFILDKNCLFIIKVHKYGFYFFKNFII